MRITREAPNTKGGRDEFILEAARPALQLWLKGKGLVASVGQYQVRLNNDDLKRIKRLIEEENLV